MRKTVLTSGGVVLWGLWAVRFLVPQNIWDWIEATRLAQESGIVVPALASIVPTVLLLGGFLLITAANWDWIKDKTHLVYNPLILLPDAALIARKKLRRTQWEKMAEQFTDNLDDAQAWFATYLLMSAPILGKKPTSIDFDPVPTEVAGQGMVCDGGNAIVTHGGQGKKLYVALAIRYRDLRKAIKKLEKDAML